MTTTRYAGIAMMASIALLLATSWLLPGRTIIDPVDQTDFLAARDALGDTALLAHWVTFAEIVSMLLMTFGALALYPLASRQGGLGGRLLQFGIIVSVIEWSFLIVAAGMRHFVIHLMQRSEQLVAGSPLAVEFEAAALDVQITIAGIVLSLMALFPLATIMLGLGLASRFSSTGPYKIASYVLAAGGLAGLVIFLLVISAPGLDIQTLIWITSMVLYVDSICLFIIGLGMYKGREGLADEGT